MPTTDNDNQNPQADWETIALLPQDDPLRQTAEQQALQSPDELKRWLGTLESAKDIKEKLNSISPAAEQLARLKSVPYITAPQQKSRNFLLAAAAILIAVPVLYLTLHTGTQPRMVASTSLNAGIKKITPEASIQKVALLAMHGYLKSAPPAILTQSPAELQTKVSQDKSIPADIPELPILEQLVGGTITTLDNVPVLATRWIETHQDNKPADILLHQFYTEPMHLPADMNATLVKINTSDDATSEACDVLIWAKDGKGYALVAKSSDGCARRALQAITNKVGDSIPT